MMSTKPTKVTKVPKKAAAAVKKEARKEARKEVRHEVEVNRKGQARVRDPNAIRAKGPHTPAHNSKKVTKFFSQKEAQVLAWAATVMNPFGPITAPPPVNPVPGVSMTMPQMFRARINGTAVANSAGYVCIGANGDGWIADPTLAPGANPVPYLKYLGNSSAYGARGKPVFYTNQSWAGNTGAANKDPKNWPNAASTTDTGLVLLPLPDQLITGQYDAAAGNGNAFQRYTNVSVGLRARPVTAALNAQGSLVAYQQLNGDNLFTSPARFNGNTATTIDVFVGMSGLPDELFGHQSVAIPDWQSDKWLTVTGIPNGTTSFNQIAPGNTGATTVGYPTVAILGYGLAAGQQIEFEVEYVYAFYGLVTYQVGVAVGKVQSSSSDEIGSVLESAINGGHTYPKMMSASTAASSKGGLVPGVKAFAQHAIDTGTADKSTVGSFIKSGAAVVESVTGAGVGEILGDIAAGIGALLL